jgi:hypothetical protein
VHNDELHNVYVSPNIIQVIKLRSMRWAGYVARMREMNAYNILVGKLEGKRPLGRSRRRWEDNRVDLREIGLEGVEWTYLAQVRDQWQAVVNTVMDLRGSIKGGEFLDQLSDD